MVAIPEFESYPVLSKNFVSGTKQRVVRGSSSLLVLTCLESPLQLRRLKLVTRKDKTTRDIFSRRAKKYVEITKVHIKFIIQAFIK